MTCTLALAVNFGLITVQGESANYMVSDSSSVGSVVTEIEAGGVQHVSYEDCANDAVAIATGFANRGLQLARTAQSVAVHAAMLESLIPGYNCGTTLGHDTANLICKTTHCFCAFGVLARKFVAWASGGASRTSCPIYSPDST